MTKCERKRIKKDDKSRSISQCKIFHPFNIRTIRVFRITHSSLPIEILYIFDRSINKQSVIFRKNFTNLPTPK